MRGTTSVIVMALTAVLAGIPLRAAGQGGPAAAKPAAAALNLNTANAAAFEALPGIGPKTAARIVEYRQKNGSFKKAEELMNVKGIGEKSFLKLKHLITVTPPKADRDATARL